MLTHDRLTEVLAYDKETGIFTRKLKTSQRAKVGEIVGFVMNSQGYLGVAIDYTHYALHRLAWFYVTGKWPKENIDHKDRVVTHNWFDNLRECNQQQNTYNSTVRMTNNSGFKGVDFHKGAYRAQMRIDGQKKHLGYFKTAELAAEAYRIKSLEIQGEFANLEGKL